MEKLKLNIQYFADGKVVIETEMDTSGVDKGLDKIKDSANNLGRDTSRLGDIIKGNLASTAISKGIGLMVSGLGKVKDTVSDLVVSGGFDRSLNIEQAEFKLKGLGHSAEEVDAIMKNALASVKGTAYGLDDAATIAASAVAAGVKPGEDLERTLKLVADTAAITGRDMNSMGAIFNKVAASGKMTGQELNQLTDAGIPMLQLLSDTLGVTTEEVKDMVSQGKIGFDEFRDAIEKGMGGAALTMGQTFSGSLSNVKAAAARLGQTFMEPLTQSLTPALGTITSIIDSIASGSMDTIDEDIAKLGEQVESGITELIENLEPILDNVLVVLEKLLPQVITTLSKLAPKIIPVIINVVNTVIKIILDNLPDILKLGIEIILALIKGIAEVTPELIPAIMECIYEIIDVIIDSLPDILDAGIEILLALIDGIVTAIPRLIEKLPEIIIKIVTTLIQYTPKLIEASIKIIVALAQGLIQALPQLIKQVPQIIVGIVQALVSALGALWDVGKQIVQGIWNGISNSLGWIKDKLTGWIGNVLSFIKRVFGIHSPSTVMRDQVGRFLALGIGEGFDEELDNVYDDMQKALDLETGKMSASVQSSGTYQMAMAGLPTFNLLDNSEHKTVLECNGKALAEVVNTENRNREVAVA